MNVKQKVGNRIRDLRIKRNLSQEKFAHLCGLDRTYIASVEKGKRNISIVNIEKIARGLDIQISELLEDV
jgi:transcriptional regulator with XRE-family HTH domain